MYTINMYMCVCHIYKYISSIYIFRSRPSLSPRTLLSLGDWLDHWALAFKAQDFKAFRFPAAADRVIYWASDELHDHLSVELPRQGYEVNHQQLGSDHRPVSLEVGSKALFLREL